MAPAAAALVAAAIAAPGLAGYSACLGKTEMRNIEILIECHLQATVIGKALCRAQGAWLKMKRHATLIGDVLIMSRNIGSAEHVIELRGMQIVPEGTVVSVRKPAGKPMVQIWLGSAEEANVWASDLDSASRLINTLPQMLCSLPFEEEKPQVEYQEQTTVSQAARSSPSPVPKVQNFTLKELAELSSQMAEKSGEVITLQRRLQGFQEMSKMLSLDRTQISELEAVVALKQAQIEELRKQVSGFQRMSKMLVVSRKEIAELEYQASGGQTDEMTKRLEKMREVVPAFRWRIDESEAVVAEKKEGMAAGLQQQHGSCEAEPTISSMSRAQVESAQADAAAINEQISTLEARLAVLEDLPGLVNLNSRQSEEAEDATRKTERQLAALGRQCTVVVSTPRAEFCWDLQSQSGSSQLWRAVTPPDCPTRVVYHADISAGSAVTPLGQDSVSSPG